MAKQKARSAAQWVALARSAKRLQAARDEKAARLAAEQKRVYDEEWKAREAKYRLAGYAIGRDGSIIRLSTGRIVGAIYVRQER